ncbi:hypothetical protein P0G10_20255, partial [Eubacteriales bacterium DFI.9.88]|nr:hypothetical protein [Eubacteriales bacterium DFI.9.88]
MNPTPEIWGLDIENMYQDVFTFQAEVIEVRNKPSHPVDAVFGNTINLSLQVYYYSYYVQMTEAQIASV